MWANPSFLGKSLGRGRFLSFFLLPFLVTGGLSSPIRPVLPGVPAASPQQDEPALKIETHVVSIPISVRDQKNRIVTDLRTEDFRLFEDEQEVPITYYGLDKTPVDVVLLLDTSRSVREELSALQESAYQFVNSLNPTDRVSVWSFSDRAERMSDWVPATISERKTVSAALRALEASGNTALYDAIRTVSTGFYSTPVGDQGDNRPRRAASSNPDALPLGINANRRCIVLLTDGDDTNSRYTQLNQAVTEALRAEISIYVISRSRVELESVERVLNYDKAPASDRLLARAQRDRLKASEKAMIDLAERTGGRVLFPTRDNDIAGSYVEIANELHQRYSIGYTPPGDPHDNKFHTTRVECKRNQVRLWAREGYFAK
ncbi:MAG: VWA domain-containing protein [Blastocatellia bacterium]|nr:VWA domain-containing protein [Blastocatellia bacterium]